MFPDATVGKEERNLLRLLAVAVRLLLLRVLVAVACMREKLITLVRLLVTLAVLGAVLAQLLQLLLLAPDWLDLAGPVELQVVASLVARLVRIRVLPTAKPVTTVIGPPLLAQLLASRVAYRLKVVYGCALLDAWRYFVVLLVVWVV